MNTRPKCIVVTGRPGAGKTTLAQALAVELRLPLLSRDQLKEGFVRTFGVSHDQLPTDTNRRVTDLFFSATHAFLEADVSVIVEAAFQHKLWEVVVPRWSLVARLCFIVCEADPALCARRHLERGLRDPSREFYHGDKRVTAFRETGEFLEPGVYDPPRFDVPTLRVSTVDAYSPSMSVIEQFIMNDALAKEP